MTNQKVLDALNDQLNEEMNSYYIYLAMATDFEFKKWLGFASWMKTQAEEEIIHARKLHNYIFSRGGKPVYKALDEPQAEYKSVKDIFEKALVHEKYITSCVENLVKIAREENDMATDSLLRWYIDEQVEEEDTLNTILDRFEHISDNIGAQYLLDQELGKRALPAEEAP